MTSQECLRRNTNTMMPNTINVAPAPRYGAMMTPQYAQPVTQVSHPVVTHYQPKHGQPMLTYPAASAALPPPSAVRREYSTRALPSNSRADATHAQYSDDGRLTTDYDSDTRKTRVTMSYNIASISSFHVCNARSHNILTMQSCLLSGDLQFRLQRTKRQRQREESRVLQREALRERQRSESRERQRSESRESLDGTLETVHVHTMTAQEARTSSQLNSAFESQRTKSRAGHSLLEERELTAD